MERNKKGELTALTIWLATLVILTGSALILYQFQDVPIEPGITGLTVANDSVIEEVSGEIDEIIEGEVDDSTGNGTEDSEVTPDDIPEGICGDGMVDPAEECDPPESNSEGCEGYECLFDCTCQECIVNEDCGEGQSCDGETCNDCTDDDFDAVCDDIDNCPDDSNADQDDTDVSHTDSFGRVMDDGIDLAMDADGFVVKKGDWSVPPAEVYNGVKEESYIYGLTVYDSVEAEDFYINTDVRIKAGSYGPNKQAGVAFRTQNYNECNNGNRKYPRYAVVFDHGDQSVNIEYHSGDCGDLVITGQELDVMVLDTYEMDVQLGTWYNLEVYARGNLFTVFVDGDGIMQYNDTQNYLSSGKFGYMLKNAAVSFDNLQVDFGDGEGDECDPCPGDLDNLCDTGCTDSDEDGYNDTNEDCGVVDCDDEDDSVYPGAVETCNNKDDDCDESIDEDLEQQCGVTDVGPCEYGTQTCSAGNWSSCTGNIDPGVESCNEVDDDCDGQTDEDTSQQCGVSDVGACQYGSRSCVGGSYGDCVGNIDPTDETCNNIDDDCDSATDEELTDMTNCNQLGACAGAYQACSAGVWGACSKLPAAEDCTNAIDDDCDGRADCRDNDCNEHVNCAPAILNFDHDFGSTNFTNVTDMTNVTNLTLGTDKGKIQFPSDHGIDASGEDYDTNVVIGDGFISVDSSVLDTSFNSSANITISGVVCPVNVYYSGGTFAAGAGILSVGKLCNEFSDPSCTNIRCVGGELSFTTSHFTGFASAPGSNITLWDEEDKDMPLAGVEQFPTNNTQFYANYSNSTGEIVGANCTIFFADKGANMSYNVTSKLYQYNRSFASVGVYGYNVTCNRTGYGSLTAVDEVGMSGLGNPSMTGITLDPNIGMWNATVNVTSLDALPIGKLVRLQCGDAPGVYNLCTGEWGYNNRSCTFQSPWSDNIVHEVYCILNDSVMSVERNNQFTADNTAPTTLSIFDVEQDDSAKYWDVIQDGDTVIRIILGEDDTSCRWNVTDTQYDNMTSDTECNVVGGFASCNVTPSVQVNLTNVSIACEDQYGNDQLKDQNILVEYGVDWTRPSVYTTNDGAIHVPGYNVSFIETDVPAGTVVHTWYCRNLSGTCNWDTYIDAGENISFDDRGVWQMRWNASDDAGNLNITGSTVVYINRVVNFSNSDTYNRSNHSVFLSVNASDPDNQNITCYIYHNLTTSPTFARKLMNLSTGTLVNGSWLGNISLIEGYNLSNNVTRFINCTDGLEWTNTTLFSQKLPNSPPSAPFNFTPLQFHNLTRQVNWTQGMDPEWDTLNSRLCIASSAADRDAEVCNIHAFSLETNNYTFVGGELQHNNTLRQYFGRIIDTDGALNSTAYDFVFNLTNARPNASFVNITPLNATGLDNLTCNYTFEDPDGDGENVSGRRFKWFLNDEGAGDFIELAETSENLTQGYDAFDLVICSVIVEDEYGLNASKWINSSVLNISGIIPKLHLINISMLEDNYNDSINVSNYVTDEDHNVTQINFSFVQLANFTITLDNVSKILNVTPAEDWCGSQMLNITAVDPDGLFSSNFTWINVECVDDLPEMDRITIDPIRGRNGTGIYVVTVNGTDADIPYGDNITLRCGDNDFVWNLCNSTDGFPERNCTFNSTWEDNAIHDIFCRLFDNDGNFSALEMRPFTADNTPPVTLQLDNIDGDTTAKYWDTNNDGQTLIQVILNETDAKCRWDENDTTYYNMSAARECVIANTSSVANCIVTPSIQINETNVTIACIDEAGNEQTVGQNLDVTYGVDWTIPTVYSSNDGLQHTPGYVVTLTIDDVPPGATVDVWYCIDNVSCTLNTTWTGTNASTLNLTFNDVGDWYLRWNASDEAGNLNATFQTIVHIVPIIITVSNSFTDYDGHYYIVNSTANNNNLQSMNCTLMHRNGTDPYVSKNMTLISGTDVSGVWTANISTNDGYAPLNNIDVIVNCSDNTEWDQAAGSHAVPNRIPTTPLINITPQNASSSQNLLCNITNASFDADSDTINYYFLWYENGTLNLTVLAAGSNTLSSALTNVGDEWNCTVIPTDGYQNGSAVSDTMNILNLTVPPAPAPGPSGGGGGGGGGGSVGGVCIEEWTCNLWTKCRDGIQTRYCWDLNRCDDLYNERVVFRVERAQRPSEVQSCEVEEEEEIVETVRVENCTDGILNQDEEDVDCGGICEPCVAIPITFEPSIWEKIFSVFPSMYDRLISFIVNTYVPKSMNAIRSIFGDILGNGFEGFVSFVVNKYVPWSISVVGQMYNGLLIGLSGLGTGIVYAAKGIGIGLWYLLKGIGFGLWYLGKGIVFVVVGLGKIIAGLYTRLVDFVADKYVPWGVDVLGDMGNTLTSELKGLFAGNNLILLAYLVAAGLVIAGIVYGATNFKTFGIYRSISHYREVAAENRMKAKKDRLKKKEIADEKKIADDKKKVKDAEVKHKEEVKDEYMHKINDYLERSIKDGQSKKEIKDALLAQGWPKKFVDKYCNKYFDLRKDVSKRLTPKQEDKLEKEMEEINARLEALK